MAIEQLQLHRPPLGTRPAPHASTLPYRLAKLLCASGSKQARNGLRQRKAAIKWEGRGNPFWSILFGLVKIGATPKMAGRVGAGACACAAIAGCGSSSGGGGRKAPARGGGVVLGGGRRHLGAGAAGRAPPVF